MFRRLLLGYRRALDFFERILMVICRLLFASVVRAGHMKTGSSADTDSFAHYVGHVMF